MRYTYTKTPHSQPRPLTIISTSKISKRELGEEGREGMPRRRRSARAMQHHSPDRPLGGAALPTPSVPHPLQKKRPH
ncbi:unnamed protein product [Larinioides sclopetarius]|uniref:Uncharacterized protein n=1 Tax=Larinioides sclopetarius TaxID=280406 RepID=A0AAV2ARQ6_9ARAC